MLVSSYHYLVGPAIAVCALGVIVLLCRWVFATDHREARRPVPADFGLLVPVATGLAADEAQRVISVLRGAGIRGTVATTADGAAVLVFRADAERARALV